MKEAILLVDPKGRGSDLFPDLAEVVNTDFEVLTASRLDDALSSVATATDTIFYAVVITPEPFPDTTHCLSSRGLYSGLRASGYQGPITFTGMSGNWDSGDVNFISRKEGPGETADAIHFDALAYWGSATRKL